MEPVVSPAKVAVLGHPDKGTAAPNATVVLTRVTCRFPCDVLHGSKLELRGMDFEHGVDCS